MRSFKSFFVLVALFLSTGAASAQTDSKEPSFGDMFQQMQQMLQQFQNGGGMTFQFPGMEGDSAGMQFFKLDTTLFSDPMFRTMPYREGGEGGMADFFRQFEQMGKMFEGFEPFGQMPQMDDGDTRSEEDLLPEEQLREQETPDGAEKKPAKPVAPKKAKKRDTVRI
jgi:hypothetical protein